MPAYQQRKYIDLIREVSSKWVNWDPPIEIKVGAYGHVDKETGELIVEGNVYDPDFQLELDKHNAGIKMADYPPQEGPVEENYIICTRGSRQEIIDKEKDGDKHVLRKRSYKWFFEREKRGAILYLHNPRQIFLPPNVVLEPLYKVDKLINKWLVTNIHVCPAYSMYLSDKTGDNISLALVSETPIATASVATASGVEWLVDAPNGILRKAADKEGNSTFTPLYSLRRPIKRIRRFFRDRITPEPTGDELWYNDAPPWDPLDDDGVEDPFDPEIHAVDPFAAVEKAAAEKAAAEKAAAEKAAAEKAAAEKAAAEKAAAEAAAVAAVNRD